MPQSRSGVRLSENSRAVRRFPIIVNTVTPDDVRRFLTDKYAGAIQGIGLDPVAVPDDFDFLLSGVVDSFGILEMVSSIEKQFEIELDLTNLDAEKMTILGPLSRYVAETAR